MCIIHESRMGERNQAQRGILVLPLHSTSVYPPLGQGFDRAIDADKGGVVVVAWYSLALCSLYRLIGEHDKTWRLHRLAKKKKKKEKKKKRNTHLSKKTKMKHWAIP